MSRIQLILLTLIIVSCAPPVIYREGPPGPKGDPGEGCSLTSLEVSEVAPNGGTLIRCGETSTILLNGKDGRDAEGLYIKAKIDPCGNAPGIDDELLLLLSDNSLLWLQVDNGKNARLSEGREGNWMTTDGSNCHFTVHSNGVVWSNGSYLWS